MQREVQVQEKEKEQEQEQEQEPEGTTQRRTLSRLPHPLHLPLVSASWRLAPALRWCHVAGSIRCILQSGANHLLNAVVT